MPSNFKQGDQNTFVTTVNISGGDEQTLGYFVQFQIFKPLLTSEREPCRFTQKKIGDLQLNITHLGSASIKCEGKIFGHLWVITLEFPDKHIPT